MQPLARISPGQDLSSSRSGNIIKSVYCGQNRMKMIYSLLSVSLFWYWAFLPLFVFPSPWHLVGEFLRLSLRPQTSPALGIFSVPPWLALPSNHCQLPGTHYMAVPGVKRFSNLKKCAPKETVCLCWSVCDLACLHVCEREREEEVGGDVERGRE